MSTSNVPRWVFDTSDPGKQGLLKAFGDTAPQTAEKFIRFGGVEKLIRICRATGSEETPHEDIDLTGATITIAAGALDAEPTAGFSNATYFSDPSGLGSIPAGATANELQLLINANTSIISDGGVTVTKQRAAYRIEWNQPGPKEEFVWFVGSLTPPSRVRVRTMVEGTPEVRAVQVVEIVQDYWAANSDWVTEDAGEIERVVLTQGTTSVREVIKITITGNPTGGKFQIEAPQAAVHTLNCVSNTQALQAEYRFTFTGNTVVTGDYVDVYDSAGPVRIWFNIAGGGGAPAAPSGGRLLEIASPDITPANLGANFHAAFAADSGLEQAGTTFGFGFVWIRTIDPGVYPEPDAPGFLTAFEFIQGTSGRLDGTYFAIYDAAGQVGVWFNVTGTTPIPAAVEAMSRSIEITAVDYSDSAADVATALAAALDADASFTAVASTSKVTVTDALGGSRGAPTNGSSPIGVVLTKPGYTISAALPFDATASQLRDAANNIYSVTMTQGPDVKEFILTATTPGELADLAVTNLSLVFPVYYRGTLSFNTLTMLHAFMDAGTANEVNGKLEAQYQFPGEDPVKFYQSPLTVLRSLIDSTALNPVNPLGAIMREGEQAIPNGADYVDVVFASPLSSADFDLFSASISNSIDNPIPDVVFLGPVAIPTVNGYRQYFSGPVSNGNYVYKYIVTA